MLGYSRTYTAVCIAKSVLGNSGTGRGTSRLSDFGFSYLGFSGIYAFLAPCRWKRHSKCEITIALCLMSPQGPFALDELEDNEPERAFLVGVGAANSGRRQGIQYSLQDSLDELAGLAEAAGLKVILWPSTASCLHSPAMKIKIWMAISMPEGGQLCPAGGWEPYATHRSRCADILGPRQGRGAAAGCGQQRGQHSHL